MAVVQINLNHARRAQDLLGQRMREVKADIAIVSEPWWVPPGDEKWLSSLGGSPLAAILVSKGGGTCSLVRRGLFFVAAKWGDSLVVSVYFPPSEDISKFCRLLDELEELLGTFPALPALVAGDFNARFPKWDPEGRSNLRGELLCIWANRLNLSLGNQVGCEDEDRLAAALVSGEWTRDNGASVEVSIKWLNDTLVSACGISMPKLKTSANWSRSVPWWLPEIAALRRAAMAARRHYLRARRSGDQARIRTCLENRRETRRSLVRAIRRAKASAWRDFLTTIEEDPWGRPYKLVMNRLRARDEIIVTIEEVRGAALRIGLGRAPGPDGIPGLVVKRAAIHCGRGLARCFTMLLRRGVFPRPWKRAKLVLIKKGSDHDDDMPSSYRPICLLDEVGKLFERVIVSMVSGFLDQRGMLSPCQYGFRVGHSTIGAIGEGSVLGPTLWNIAYDRVLRVPLPEGSRVVCYADDTALLSAGRDPASAMLACEKDLEVLVNEIENAGLLPPCDQTQGGLYCGEAQCQIPEHSFRFRIDFQAPLRGLNSESAGDPSVHWEDPSEPPRAEGKEATPL
ncbi:uncharacterized protein LOC122520393 [Polistes fuscatus]|uniref:uncharacterized protein LOC122520393 n=1 Tax=Polistes fuscatus TaxID=30207 RepID=UPI001CA7E52E|nr:uncharacterized protein LOC122520393 [Polistes fuscatus]